MSSLIITTRQTRTGPRYVVRYRLGGRAYPIVHGGSFKTLKEAKARRDLVGGILAAGQNPAEVLRAAAQQPRRRTFAEWAEAYQTSRVDFAAETAKSLSTHLRTLSARFGELEPQALSHAEIQAWVNESNLKPSSLRKYLQTLRVLLDYAGLEPNPARDRRVRLPRSEREEPRPPTSAHVESVYYLLPPSHRLPLLLLDATGMRVGELAQLLWEDIDEPGQRWRVSAAVSKTRRARFVSVPEPLFAAVLALCPREDRVPERRVFQSLSGDGLRLAIARACKAAGVPHFSPHDLRHRRISLLHLGGEPWARIGEYVGQRDLATTANVYTHVLGDATELEYAVLLT